MMGGFFAGMMLVGMLTGALTGRLAEVGAALLTQSSAAVQLCLTLTGSLCFWGGLMRVAEDAGATEALSRALLPLTRRLFPALHPKGEALSAITMNLIANILGLGNAATPLGLRAMRAMQAEERAAESATNSMARFVVMNTASLQLLPATVAMLRAQAGAAEPMRILPAVWLSSLGALAAALTAACLLERKR